MSFSFNINMIFFFLFNFPFKISFETLLKTLLVVHILQYYIKNEIKSWYAPLKKDWMSEVGGLEISGDAKTQLYIVGGDDDIT